MSGSDGRWSMETWRLTWAGYARTSELLKPYVRDGTIVSTAPLWGPSR